MNAYKIRIAFFELMGDKFTSLIDFDMTCKENELKKTLEYLKKEILKFIEKNKNGEKNEQSV